MPKTTKPKRFSIASNFGHWSVIDSFDRKMVVGYNNKEDAQKTSDGLNRIRKTENIEAMKKNLKTKNGYSHYLN